MKIFSIAISLLAVLCSANAQSLRSQINASDKTIHKLMMARDMKGFSDYMKGAVTPDFKYVEAGKTLDFNGMCAGMAMGFGQMKKMMKADSRIVKLHESGHMAEATILHVMEATVMGGDSKAHKMSFKGTSADTYEKLDGKWKMSKMAWITQSTMVDGKPMGAMPSGAPKNH